MFPIIIAPILTKREGDSKILLPLKLLLLLFLLIVLSIPWLIGKIFNGKEKTYLKIPQVSAQTGCWLAPPPPPPPPSCNCDCCADCAAAASCSTAGGGCGDSVNV